MTQSVVFANDEASYAELVFRVEEVLDVTKRFPQWPFRATAFAAIADDLWFRSGAGGEVLEKLAQRYGDEDFTVVGFENATMTHEYNRSVYQAFSIRACGVKQNYKAAVNKERVEPDCSSDFSVEANSIAIVGSSRQWSVWSERNWEIGVLLTPEPVWSWLDTEAPFFGGVSNLAYITGPVFAGKQTPMSDEQQKFWESFESYSR